jgi:hypothetical protein
MLEAPVHWRRDRTTVRASAAEGMAALEAASESLRKAREERQRQEALAAAEHVGLILPLRQMREQNHFSDLIIDTIRRNRDDSGTGHDDN